MRVTPGQFDGILVVEPDVFADERGFFLETFDAQRYQDVGIRATFVQDNHSRSVGGTVRGLHFHRPPGQPKLVWVSSGSAWDVVVDLRRDSPTFGRWEAFELDDRRHLQIYVPPGFAHGYCSLTDEVDFAYKVGAYYDPAAERGIAWDDPDLAIPWPVATPLLSDRDKRNPRLRALPLELTAWPSS